MRQSIETRTAALFRSHGLTSTTVRDFDSDERAEIARKVFRVLYAEYTFAEVKRMIVGDAFRRRGVGTALIAGAEREAARLGIGTLLLEVGTRNEEAHAMYRRAGFLPRGAFAPYDATPISRFLEKRLSSPSPPPAR